MYHLGADEWEDTEAAIEFALDHGARRIVLMGWSMGGGITLRTSVRSAHRERIAGLVLDSPAVDWQDILIYHATALKAPEADAEPGDVDDDVTGGPASGASARAPGTA